MLFKLVIVGIAVYLLYKLLRSGSRSERCKATYEGYKKPCGGEDLVEDQVCHTYIPLSNAVKMNLDGKTVYFCSQKCRDAYVQVNKK